MENSHRRRGSAIVELSLSLTFIVPVMLYAGYLTDALYDGVKAEEATAAAAWSFTGHLLHDYDGYNHSSKYTSAASAVRSEVDHLYHGLEPWSVAGLGQSPTELQGVSAKGTLLTGSDCAPFTGGSVQDPSKFLAMPGTLSNGLHTGGLISCQQEVKVTNWLWGKATGTNTSILGTQNKVWPSGMLSTIEQCGVGSAKGGSCKNTGQAFVMYTDDWGLAEAGNSSGDDDYFNYPDDSAQNKHFVKLGQLVYEDGIVPYPVGVQVAEGAASLAFCSNEIPIDPVPALDKQYAGGAPHNTFNLSETQWQGTGSESMDTNSPTNSYEGSIKQSSYTWPVRVYSTGPIKPNSYVQTLNARSKKYLGAP